MTQEAFILDEPPIDEAAQVGGGADAIIVVGEDVGDIPTFKMRGRDDGRSPGSDYIIWLHTGAEPDFAGAGFAGGTPTPIGSLIAGSVVNITPVG